MPSAALPIALALSIASQAAPTVAPDTLVTFAMAESRLQPLTIHDNATGQSYFPDTREEATALAASLVNRGHSVDLGIMQVNSANLRRVDLQISDAFDPAKSFRAGGAILVDAYLQCHGDNARTHQQLGEALRCASSVYNTGNERAGLTNGYTASIVKVAAHVVPSIKELLPDFSGAAPNMPSTVSARLATESAEPKPASPPPPASGWDVFAQSGGTQFVYSK